MIGGTQRKWGELLIKVIVMLSLTSAVMADYFFGYIEYGRIAVFCFWVLILSKVIVAGFGQSEDIVRMSQSRFLQILSWLNLFVLVFCGWTVTAVGWFIGMTSMYIKQMDIKEKAGEQHGVE